MYMVNKRWGNKPINFFAMLIVVIFATQFLLIVFGIVSGGSSDGIIETLVSGILKVIPFGSKIGEVVCGTLDDVFGFATGPFVPTSPKLSASEAFRTLLQEFMKLILATIAYEALFGFFKKLTSLEWREGVWNFGQKVLLEFFCAFAGGLVSCLVCGCFVKNLSKLPEAAQFIILIFVILFSIGGLFAVVFLLSTVASMAVFILSFITRYILVGAVKLLVTYALMLTALLAFYGGNPVLVLTSCSSIIVLFIMLGAIDLMLKPVFE